MQLQASEALLFLKNIRSVALYVREDGASTPKLLYRMRLSVPDVRSLTFSCTEPPSARCAALVMLIIA